MEKTIKVRSITIGEGKPKICVPVLGITREAIMAAAKKLPDLSIDMVEWRADWFRDISDTEQAVSVAAELREILGDTVILFTFRTAGEGGEQSIEPEAYMELNLQIARSGYVDFIDVEAFTGDDIVAEIIEQAHCAGVKVIASNHDFQKTPPREEIIRRLRKMQELGADIPKIAVMPQNKQDVLTLLSATEEMARTYADRPIITMSMASDGMISRLSGEVFGSALTFGAVGKISAPGQIEVEELTYILDIIHRNSGV